MAKRKAANEQYQGENYWHTGNFHPEDHTIDFSGVSHQPRDGKHNDGTGLSGRIASPVWANLTAYLNALVSETRKNLQGMLLFMRKVRFLEMEYGRYLRTSSYSHSPATVNTYYPLRVTSGATGEYKNQSVELGSNGELEYRPRGLGKRLYTGGKFWRKILLNVGAEARLTLTNANNGTATTVRLFARVILPGVSEIFSCELDRISLTTGTTAQSVRLFGSDIIPIEQLAAEEYELEFSLQVSQGANTTVQIDSSKMYFHKAGWYRGQKLF